MVKKQTIHLEEWLMISEMLHDGGAWVANLDEERCPISSSTGENHKKMPVPTMEQQEALQGCVKVGAPSHRRKMVHHKGKCGRFLPLIIQPHQPLLGTHTRKIKNVHLYKTCMLMFYCGSNHSKIWK